MRQLMNFINSSRLPLSVPASPFASSQQVPLRYITSGRTFPLSFSLSLSPSLLLPFFLFFSFFSACILLRVYYNGYSIFLVRPLNDIIAIILLNVLYFSLQTSRSWSEKPASAASSNTPTSVSCSIALHYDD